MLTQRQIKSFVGVGSLPDTAVDFLCFVTEFFDVIQQSGPHIYHSALLLAPQLLVIRNLYSHQIRSPVSKVINGIPASWDSCTASAGAGRGVLHAAWSPCGQFIAANFEGVIQIRDSNTLERLSVLNPPLESYLPDFEFLTFSPDRCMLAYVYKNPSLLVVFPVSVPTLTSIPRNRKNYVCVWDVQTGVAIINIIISQFAELVFSGNCRTITLWESYDTFSTYDGVSGTYICGGKLPVSPGFLPGAHWAYDESFQFSTSSKSNGKLMVNIQEVRPTSTPPFHVVKSFTVPPHSREISFSHVSFHASFTTEMGVVILNLHNSRTLL